MTLSIFAIFIYFLLEMYVQSCNEHEEVLVSCENCGKEFIETSLANHISHRPDCKTFYGPRLEEMKKKRNQERVRKFRKKNGLQRELEGQRRAYDEKKKDSDANLAKYFKEIEFGPEFICICCHASLDENQVLVFTDERKEKIGQNLFETCCDIRQEFYDPREKGRYFICKYCFKHMSKKRTMPNRCFKNGLIVEDIPEDLADFTGLENSLIAKYIIFMKISKVPKSGIELMKDRTVLVPIEPGDIIDSVETTLLPRTMAESSIVPVDLKKIKAWKYIHQSGFVRPVKMLKALAFLKNCQNEHYQDVILRCVFCDRQFLDSDTDVLEHIEECHMNALAQDDDVDVENECNDNALNENEADENEVPALQAVTRYQALDDVTCIQTNNPEVDIVTNTSNQPKTVPVKDSITGKSVVLAPGEDKIPSVIMREKDFDVKAFPLKHPSGHYGLNFDRPVKISKQQYFRIRIFHYSGIFSKDNDYLFMSQQYIERAAIEGQIGIAGVKGVMSNGPGGTKSMQLTDAFSVFQKIPGTPKYWQQKRNNLLAMINVFGPFQWFFTFSCAEIRWPQIISSVLRQRGHKVEVVDKYISINKKKFENIGIRVDGKPLEEYLSMTGQTLRGIIQKETFLVTRMFDTKVKSFVKNILMDQGPKGMQLKTYMYRVEFQGRLAPHIHGCAWMKDDAIGPYLVDGSSEFTEKVPDLIDKFVSCSLPDDEQDRKIVQDLQSHKCTKTCTKKGPHCRFGFPKLPSNKTLIAHPKDKCDEDGQEELKSNLALLQKMKSYLENDENDRNRSLEDILKDLGLTSDEYHAALATSDRGKQVVLKRKPNECFINNYNLRFIDVFQANMDLQFCTDAYAVVTYVCDYWSKDDTGMTAFLKESFKEGKSWGNQKLLTHLKRTYMSKRQIGKCEAIYRAIPSMHLQEANVACTFVQSGYSENQSCYLRKAQSSEKPEHQSNDSNSESDSSDDEENDKIETNMFTVPGREGLFMMTEKIHDKYAARPDGVETLVLSQFATCYTKCQRRPKTVQFNELGVTEKTGNIKNHLTDEPLPLHIKLRTNEVYRLRKFCSVLRIHASSKKDGLEEYYAEMQLFSPWREEKLKEWKDPNQCVAQFQERQRDIHKVRTKIFPFSMNQIMEEFKAQEVLNRISEETGNMLDAQGAQDNEDVLDEGLEELRMPIADFETWLDDNNALEPKTRSEGGKYRTLELQSMDDLLETTLNLVPEQQVALQKVVDFAKSVVQCRNSNLARDAPKQLGLILHGGGGVGKSATTKVCAQWAEHILRRAGDNQTKPRILLLCPTGMAASVIDGATICSSLELFFGSKYKGLTDQSLAQFRSEFEELKLIIIDEMSMVGADDLYKIHRRLVDIFNNNLPFGGLGMMFVGDMLQLKPPKGRFIFEMPRNESHALSFEAQSLWHGLEAVTLKHNHRQGEDKNFLETLNRMRIGEVIDEDIVRLKSRCVSKLSKKFPQKACNLYYTNVEVNDHNIKMLNGVKGQLYSITYVGDFPKGYKPTIQKHGVIDDTGLFAVLKIKIGARVMVVLNIDTSDSLVNGSLGVIVDIITETDGKVKCIIVKFDNEKTGAMRRERYLDIGEKYKEERGTPIFRKDVKYHLGSGEKKHAARATVFQFPIKLAFAITGHKMQGQTIKRGSKLVVNWSNILPPALSYVMCSRCETIEDLFIAGKFDPGKIRCHKKALEEAKRLDEISLSNLPIERVKNDELFGFAMVNIRSITKHGKHLARDGTMMQYDTIFVTETWKKTFDIEGYNNVFAQGTTGRARGVGVFFKNDAEIETCQEDLYEFIKFKTESITIFCLYISKGCDFQKLVQSLCDYDFNNKEENTFLIGDLNFDAPGNNNLSNYLSRLEFKQMVGRATHLDGHILDHVYVPQAKSTSVDIKHHHVYYSDHDGILVSVKKDVAL